METILSISEISDNQDGYEIKTDQQVIRVAIDNGQDCCEHWGYFSTHDNLQDFVGTELLSIKTTDDLLSVQTLNDVPVSVDSCVFVTFETSGGSFQLVVYNEHNGYYSHKVTIESKQLTEEFYL